MIGKNLGGEDQLATSGWAHRVWPIGITVWLLIVVLVNIAFIVIAVGGADPVAESYEAGER
jgi:hypothetical protein